MSLFRVKFSLGVVAAGHALEYCSARALEFGATALEVRLSVRSPLDCGKRIFRGKGGIVRRLGVQSSRSRRWHMIEPNTLLKVSKLLAGPWEADATA